MAILEFYKSTRGKRGEVEMFAIDAYRIVAIRGSRHGRGRSGCTLEYDGGEGLHEVDLADDYKDALKKWRFGELD